MPFVDLNGMIDRVRELSGSRTLLTFHSIGDTDSVASAMAMSLAFHDSVICTPDKVTSNAERILRKLGFDEDAITREFDDSAETVVMLDVNNVEGCGSFREKLLGFKGSILVIDHHRAVEDLPNMTLLADESHNSAASLSYAVLKGLGILVDARMAKLLAMGIISDSAEFKNAMPNTFEQLGELLGIAETDYISLITEMGHISPAEERIKTIDDVVSSKLYVKNGLLFCTGEAHAFSNLAADAAIRMGVDVSLFYSMGREISFSARLRPTLDKKFGIHLGKVMKELSPLIDGTGGGHPCAAGAYGTKESGSGEFARRFLDMIAESVYK